MFDISIPDKREQSGARRSGTQSLITSLLNVQINLHARKPQSLQRRLQNSPLQRVLSISSVWVKPHATPHLHISKQRIPASARMRMFNVSIPDKREQSGARRSGTQSLITSLLNVQINLHARKPQSLQRKLQNSPLQRVSSILSVWVKPHATPHLHISKQRIPVSAKMTMPNNSIPDKREQSEARRSGTQTLTNPHLNVQINLHARKPQSLQRKLQNSPLQRVSSIPSVWVKPHAIINNPEAFNPNES